ncbi:MAG: hypothetical protein ACE5EO_01030 [Candidatus Krumholzibacteriia bacterium]
MFWQSISLIAMVVLLCQCGGDDPPVGPAGQEQIVLSKATVDFATSHSAGDPAPQTVTVSNGASGSLTGLAATVTYGGVGGWLTATFDRTTAPAELTLQAQVASTPNGSHTATVSISSGVAANSPQAVSVTCFIAADSPRIVLSTQQVIFNAPVGGPDPLAQTLDVTNGGDLPLGGLAVHVEYGGLGGWLSAALHSTTAPATITLQATAGTLPAGVHSAFVIVSSPDAPNAIATASFNVGQGSGPLIALSLTETTIVGRMGNPDPPPWWVTVMNSGTGSVTELSTSIAYDPGQPTGWLTATFEPGTTAPTNLKLQGSLAGLSSGQYGATVSVSSPVADNSPQDVGVTFEVLDPPRRITLTNQMSQSLSIHDVVQFKVAQPEAGLYVLSDSLTDDPARCLAAPGESIFPGDSRTFRIPFRGTYHVFIGIGAWNHDPVGCTPPNLWFKRRYFTTPGPKDWFVWAVVPVTTHVGEWNWMISGSYEDGSLVVTPDGGTPITFNVGEVDPIP